MKELLIIAISSALVSNVVLSQFLGICSFVGVSKKVETAAGMGGAVIFVITIALVCIGSLREILGAGTIFGIKVTPAGFEPISIFILAPGAFFVLSILTALQNKLKAPCATNGSVKKKKKSTACSGDCLSCPSHNADKE